jgi:2-haloacid dehalogenase
MERSLPEEAKSYLNHAWHRLDAWPDVSRGLHLLKRRFLVAPVSNGNISLMVDLARPTACRRTQSWAPRVYLAAAEAFDLPPGACMMVAAHTNDLVHAAACGLRTAHVARPNERGQGRGEAAPGKPVDVAVAGLPELADRLVV